MTTAINQAKMDELRDIAVVVLEIEDDEITPTSMFIEDHDADSLRAIEILARIEKKYKIDIPQAELPNMVNLQAVYGVVAKYAGWQD
jgi:acyl carrier protein